GARARAAGIGAGAGAAAAFARATAFNRSLRACRLAAALEVGAPTLGCGVLKQQLNLYKHPPYNEKACIRFSVKRVAHKCEQLQQLLESLIRKHFVHWRSGVQRWVVLRRRIRV